MRYPIKRNSPQKISAIRQPSLLEVGWVAGIYEGEGSVESYVQSGRKNTVISVQVFQNDPWMLYKFQEFYGGSVGSYKNRTGHFWKLTGQRAVDFLCGIAPLLSPRRIDQARFHIARYNTNEIEYWAGGFNSDHFIPNKRSKTSVS